MDGTVGASAATLTFDTGGQSAYWYTDLSYPTGADDASIVAGDYLFEMYFDQLPDWWDTNYSNRQQITVTAGSAAVPSGYNVSVAFDHAALTTAKSLASGDDVRVVYWNGSTWVELDRFKDPLTNWDATDSAVWFRTQAAISASGTDTNYYLYYGNSGAGAPPMDRAQIFDMFDTFTNLNNWTDFQDDGDRAPQTVNNTTSGGTLTVDSGGSLLAGVQHNTYAPGNTYGFASHTFARSLSVVTDDLAPTCWFINAPAGETYCYQTRGSAARNRYVRKHDDLQTTGSDTNIETETTTGPFPTANTWYLYEVQRLIDGTMRAFRDGSQQFPLSGWSTADTTITSGGFGLGGEGASGQTYEFDWVWTRKLVDPEPSAAPAGEEGIPSVDITVSVHHTDTDGTAPQLITSTSATIDPNTVDGFSLNLGSGAAQTYTQADPQLLRFRVTVDAINNGGSFTLAYDSAVDPTNLETPSLTVFDASLLVIVIGILIPILTYILTERRRRRTAARVLSLILSFFMVLGLLASDVATAIAAPDSFYLHDTDTGSTPAWYDTNWTFRKKLTIDSAQVPANQTNFPVLVSLATDTDLAADAQDSPTAGFDILFTDSTGTFKLSHELEKFDDTTGELIAWVELSSLSSSADTEFYMYYGNASAGDQQDLAGTWSSGFDAVYHLHDDFADSTTNHAIGTNSGSADISDGIAGEAQNFVQGQSDYIDTNWTSNYSANGDFGWAGWFRLNGQGGTDDILGIEDRGGGDSSEIRLSLRDDLPPSGEGDSLDIYVRPDGGGATAATVAVTAPDDGNWHYAVLQRDGSNYRIYYDGAQVDSAAVGTGAINSPVTLLIGAQWQTDSSGQRNYFNGDLDEIRLTTDAKSANWIQTEYNNLSSPSTFYKTLGSEENAPPSPTGKYMNTTLGSGAATLAFNTAGQDGYWYSDISYPTGLDDGSIAAGNYTLNMYFSSLPSNSIQVSDTFTESTDTAITSHSPDTGTGWTEVYDNSLATTDANVDATLDIVDAGSDENLVGQAYTAQPAPSGVEQALSFTLTAVDTTTGRKPVGVFARRTDNDNFYLIQIYPDTAPEDSIQLFKHVGGVSTFLDLVDPTISIGDTFKLEVTDAAKKVYHNGSEVLSSTDNALTAAGTWGLYFGNFSGAGVTGSHMRMTWDVDDFLAEDLASVDVTVTVSHTDTDGSAPISIVSSSTTIDANTSNPLAFAIGSGSEQTFTAADPQLLRSQIHVDGVNGGGAFTLAYDSVADPTNLETPVVTVPDFTLAFVALAVFIPLFTFVLTERRRRRAAARILSVGVALLVALSLSGCDHSSSGSRHLLSARYVCRSLRLVQPRLGLPKQNHYRQHQSEWIFRLLLLPGTGEHD